ncbi:MAG TPA: tRNA pseudouridine(55) synthase TruB, partial [Tepidisphaeraceae bacterium]|nr:tRNA pseudouridine(55) synthase TruB [Tepidisphaeraceae bacterium]
MTGLLIMQKDTAMTSARTVDAVKRMLPRGVKVGHAGALDSFATGILIVMIGTATRYCERIMDWPKTYEAMIGFGATTITDDPDSPEQIRDANPIGRDVVENSLKRFIGAISQRPPVYSAVKVGGKRASDRARGGLLIPLAPRMVEIYSIALLSYDWPLLKIRVECGRGTYIRALSRDLGETLGVGGYVKELQRT